MPHVHCWEIWLVYLRFADKPDIGKVRPILVLAHDSNFIYAAKISSRDAIDGAHDYQLRDWQAAGLHRPSIVVCNQQFALPHTELLHKTPVGTVTSFDACGVTKLLQP